MAASTVTAAPDAADEAAVLLVSIAMVCAWVFNGRAGRIALNRARTARFHFCPSADGRALDAFHAASSAPRVVDPSDGGQRNAGHRQENSRRSSRPPARWRNPVLRWQAGLWSDQDNSRDRGLAACHPVRGLAHGASMGAWRCDRGCRHGRRPLLQLRQAQNDAAFKQHGPWARSYSGVLAATAWEPPAAAAQPSRRPGRRRDLLRGSASPLSHPVPFELTRPAA